MVNDISMNDGDMGLGFDPNMGSAAAVAKGRPLHDDLGLKNASAANLWAEALFRCAATRAISASRS